MSEQALQALKAEFGDAIIATQQHAGDDTAVVQRERVLEILTWLKNHPELSFNALADEAGMDYLRLPEMGHGARFAVVYHLYSFKTNKRLRIKAPVPEADPAIDSISGLWKMALWCEREIWDLYGITFKGHPDLRRILMYEEFIGHPLRKDYPVDQRQPRIGPRN